MKIGIVSWSFYPRNGGLVSIAFDLEKAFRHKGIQVEIIAPWIEKDIVPPEKISGVKIHWVHTAARNFDSHLSRALFVLALSKRIRTLADDFDIFYSLDFHISMFSCALAAKKPFVTLFASDPLFEFANYSKKVSHSYCAQKSTLSFCERILKKAISVSAEKASAVISPHPFNIPSIKAYTNTAVTSIPCGIHIDEYKTIYEIPVSEKLTQKRVLIVSRHVSWKNLEASIEILKNLKQDIKFCFVGDGPFTEHYIEKYGELENIEFHRDISRDKLKEFYSTSSLLFVPSKYETFSIVVLEAMASGLPVITSDLEVFKDRIIPKETGDCVDINNISEVAQAITRTLNNEQSTCEIVENAYKKAQEYDMSSLIDKHISLFEGLIR